MMPDQHVALMIERRVVMPFDRSEVMTTMPKTVAASMSIVM